MRNWLHTILSILSCTTTCWPGLWERSWSSISRDKLINNSELFTHLCNLQFSNGFSLGLQHHGGWSRLIVRVMNFDDLRVGESRSFQWHGDFGQCMLLLLHVVAFRWHIFSAGIIWDFNDGGGWLGRMSLGDFWAQRQVSIGVSRANVIVEYYMWEER